MHFEIKIRILCEIIWSARNNKDLLERIMSEIKRNNSYSEVQYSLIELKLKYDFLPQYNRKWRVAKRNKKYFIAKHAK